MKNLVLNNYHEQDMEKDFRAFLKNNFTENQEIWLHFQTAFWPENREASFTRFLSLKSGDNILCRTVFDGYGQLELMVNLLCELKKYSKKLNIYISHPSLAKEIKKYLDKSESELTPQTDWYNDSYIRREKFKKTANKKLLEAISFHNVYQLTQYVSTDLIGKPKRIITADLIK